MKKKKRRKAGRKADKMLAKLQAHWAEQTKAKARAILDRLFQV